MGWAPSMEAAPSGEQMRWNRATSRACACARSSAAAAAAEPATAFSSPPLASASTRVLTAKLTVENK